MRLKQMQSSYNSPDKSQKDDNRLSNASDMPFSNSNFKRKSNSKSNSSLKVKPQNITYSKQ